jgi:hypothetical protein
MNEYFRLPGFTAEITKMSLYLIVTPMLQER